jgi:sigma-B regulation protein RsbU (phosphoserine phosphatase)
MIEAPIPEADAERLRALWSLKLLDTPPDERFDRITRLLAHMFQAPMAYISLVDADRQWFKSSCGMGVAETLRAISFCGHAILSEEALVVPDARKDMRFWDNPLVTDEPYIRFYAGQPLRAPGGHKVGTLCVADRRPREFSDADRQALVEMARLVEREFQLVETVQLQKDLITAQERAAEADHLKVEYLGRLVDSQQHLVRELHEAVGYVRSLLPEPLEAPVRTRWLFVPSSQLGGDCFGYGWVDDDHFAVYLLDVCGHGVGAALLSISVMNALRAQALQGTDFRDPAGVLAGLNDAFPMDRQNGKYFTIWYGVFDRRGRRLAYASAGHPPAVLLTGPAADRARAVELGMANFAIGVMPGEPFNAAATPLDTFGKMYVFSDGVYEVEKPDGTMMRRQELVRYLATHPGPGGPEDVLDFARHVGGLKDDFSLLEIGFP